MIRERDWSKKLHWTTTASEKILLGVIGTLTMVAASLDVYKMIMVHFKIELAELKEEKEKYNKEGGILYVRKSDELKDDIKFVKIIKGL